jgi:hypothetical protein
MNLLNRAILSQQQSGRSRQVICPACELPALFYRRNGATHQVEQWICGHCGEAVPLSDPWPIAPVARTPIRFDLQKVPLPALLEDCLRFDLVEMI